MVKTHARAVVGLTLVLAPGCRFLESGPNDKEVMAAVVKTPPAPPTLGPSYLAKVTSVKVEERGRYNADGNYWPVRVRVKGSTKAKPTGVLQLALADAAAKQTPQALEFVEEARLVKDDFGAWHVSYNYDPRGPGWRLTEDVSRGKR